MHDERPSFEVLEGLVTSADVRDRAFAASVLSFRQGAGDRERVARLYQRLREGALLRHADVRRRIRQGTLDLHAFVARLREGSLETRDHLVEEILDVAYPPPVETTLPPDSIAYCPSGLAEILFMIENADLGPGKTFVDLGSGLGKVVHLVALLTGARAYGVELDPHLVHHARSAAGALALEQAHFIEGDLRSAPLPRADVYYMYIPVMDSTAIAARLRAFAAGPRVLLFAPTLELTRLPWLRATNAGSYWLEMYEGASPA